MTEASRGMDEDAFVRHFYQLRAARRPELLRPFIAEDVVWEEPVVGAHMGRLVGVECVLDMIGRALAATDGSFDVQVEQTVAVDGHCAAVIAWSAVKGGAILQGRELAVFEIAAGRIVHAQFFAENIAHDAAFWSNAAASARIPPK